MEARAKVSFVRMTPRKVKIVCDVIRGKDVNTAAAILANLPKAAAEPVAVENVENTDAPAAEPVVEEAAETPAPAEVVEADDSEGVHKILKTKFIEGGAEFMALVAVAMVIGLAFCVERIIYLSMAKVDTKKLMTAIAEALSQG